MNEKSIWNDVVTQLDSSPPVSVDYPTLEKLFGQVEQKKQTEDKLDSSSVSKRRQDSTISFLDSKISMNLNITLKAFKTDPAGVAAIVRDCSSEKTDIDHLRNLLKVLPEKDEVLKLI